MKFYKNAEIEKLTEYSRSYGPKEVLKVPLMIETENQISIYGDNGELFRVFRKGTKLLQSFKGREINQKTFQKHVKRLKAEAKARQEQQNAIYAAQQEIVNKTIQRQAEIWEKFLKENPDKAIQYRGKINGSSSKVWRNWIKMKFVSKCNNNTFAGAEITPPRLKEVLFSI